MNDLGRVNIDVAFFDRTQSKAEGVGREESMKGVDDRVGIQVVSDRPSCAPCIDQGR